MVLPDKAKGSPNALYDQVYRKDALAFAYDCRKTYGSAAEFVGQTFEDIETHGRGCAFIAGH